MRITGIVLLMIYSFFYISYKVLSVFILHYGYVRNKVNELKCVGNLVLQQQENVA